MLSASLSRLFACLLFLQPGEPVQITVAAASDLAPIENKIKILVKQQGAYSIRFVFGSSGQLATQIRAGAPYDVFLSANYDYVRALEPTGRLVPGSSRAFARGRLALYARSAKVKSIQDLAEAAVRTVAIANPAHAPYGVAARQALGGVMEAVGPKLVYAENVRQALQFAESGNADAALVAWPMVKDRAGAVLLAESTHGPIVQGAGVVRSTLGADAESRGVAAIAFVDLLTSKAGQVVLAEAGFVPLPAAPRQR